MDVTRVNRKRKPNDQEGALDNVQQSHKNKKTSSFVDHDLSYSVGWICALPLEQTAALASLDEIHDDVPIRKSPNDSNAYTLGSIGEHKIVVACLPKGQVGLVSAATVATRMVTTFPSIKIGLLVGIGGGVPPSVRLGDVVVSTPTAALPGVVQWDMGKSKLGSDGKAAFERTGCLNNPPISLLTAVSKLESLHALRGSRVPEYLESMGKRWPRLISKYARSKGRHRDFLFPAKYSHINDQPSVGAADEQKPQHDDPAESTRPEGFLCEFCDPGKARERNQDGEVEIHYGLIASGNQVIKDAAFRDRLNRQLGGNVLCFEMEAAGLMMNFPCLIIRGICDYADAHKNDAWQHYAAATASAFAKELLDQVEFSEVDREKSVRLLISDVQSTMTLVQDNVNSLNAKLVKDNQLAFLRWLASVDYRSQQSDFLRRKQPETGEWFLASDEYRSWLAKPGQTLFCPGIPGSGKTIMTSVVIDDISTRFVKKDGATAITYIFYNFKIVEQQRLEDLLATLLEQLVVELPEIPESVGTLCETHKGKRTRPSSNELLEALQATCALFSRVFVLVDALDEGHTEGFQLPLVDTLFDLQAKSPGRFSLLFTSRHLPGIDETFNAYPKLQIHANNQDILHYAHGRFDDLLGWIQVSEEHRLQVRDEITLKVTSIASGMFLLAQLCLDALKDQTSLREIRSTLKDFGQQDGPHALGHAYDQTMHRIQNQPRNLHQLAIKVICWVTHAKRPITISALQHALSIEPGDVEFDPSGMRGIEVILSVCTGLVTIDDETGVIRLIHYTAQEYFQRPIQHAAFFAAMKTTISSFSGVCATYLSFTAFSGFKLFGEDKVRRLESQYPFLSYAAECWGDHAAEDPSLSKEVADFLFGVSTLDVLSLKKSPFSSGHERPYYSSGLHWAAFYGILNAIDMFYEHGHDINKKDNFGLTPIYYAAVGAQTSAIERLLQYSASANTTSWTFKTPLHVATQAGNYRTLELLVEDGAYIDATAEQDKTPVQLAEELGRLDIVDLYLSKGTRGANNMNHMGESASSYEGGNSPLHLAVEKGQVDTIEFLLSEEFPVNSEDSRMNTPLYLAIQQERLDIIQLLASKGAWKINQKGCSSSLMAAVARRGSAYALDLLWAHQGPMVDFDNMGSSLLHLAAEGGNFAMIEALIRRGFRLNTTNKMGLTPLCAAITGGMTQAVITLLNSGCDVNTVDNRGRSPLALAVNNCNTEVVTLLLERDALVNTMGLHPWTSVLEKQGVIEVSPGTGPNEGNVHVSKGSANMTPLILASSQGWAEGVKLLIDHGADLDTKGPDGHTALSIASARGHGNISALLTTAGANTDPDRLAALPGDMNHLFQPKGSIVDDDL